ncbi:MAG TPA: hypothetical protein VLE27_15690, partial [Thermoanaerobaculia bacterium]|nr:hypothetical protein [Thermoanaerobaculia bacterium]
MAHLGLGQLLREFDVEETADYYALPPGTQSAFVSRLYSELEDHAKKGIESIKLADGLKLHFVVKELPDEGFSNLPTDAFFRKTCFYANKTLVTFPFRDSERSSHEVVRRGHSTTLKHDKEIVSFGKYRTRRGGYGGEVQEVGKNHHLYRAEFNAFLHLLCTARPFLDSGFLTIVPSYQPEAKKFNVRTKARFGLHSANFHMDELRKQFEEEGYEDLVMGSGVVPYLYLPYFSNLTSRDVMEVRQEEQDHYIDFQRLLTRLLSGMDDIDSEKKLLDHLREIDEGVRKLVRSYEAILKADRRRDIATLMGFVAVGLLMLLPPATAAAITAIVGSGTLPTIGDYIKLRRETDPLKAK